MKILVVGSGGREHALAWKLSQSPRVTKVFAAPGNPGTAEVGENVDLAASDIEGLVAFAQHEAIGLTVIGPDDALAAGIVDAFESAGLRAFGPRKAAAQLESSKIFAKEFMRRHGIPTAESREFTESADAHLYARSAKYPIVIKADGLALGKGVMIAANPSEAAHAIYRTMDARAFGEAGSRIVIEEFLDGTECSIHALVDGATYQLFPDCRDHKQACDGNTGPNTGGMGAVSPSGRIDFALDERIREEVMDRFMVGLTAEGLDFRGMLFPGLMLTAEGPKVLEFNCRWGDPETQVLVRRLESDLLEALEATVDARLAQISELRWGSDVAICVILASGGYPAEYAKNLPIRGVDDASRDPGVVVFQAGTHVLDGSLVTLGGRVLGVTAVAADVSGARATGYAAADKIHFDNVHRRDDIGVAP